MKHSIVAAFAVVLTLLATWGSGFLNRHHSLENAYDKELIRLRAFGLPCGVERWSVKTLADSAASQISFSPVYTNVPKLVSLPSTLSGDGPRVPGVETTLYQLSNTHLVKFKLEGDSDIHLVLRSSLPGNPTMIAEIPDPGCVSTNPAVAAEQQQIGVTRAAFMSYITSKGLQLQTYFQSVDWVVTLRGVGFFDFLHGQTGVAPNGIELHPVLFFKGG